MTVLDRKLLEESRKTRLSRHAAVNWRKALLLNRAELLRAWAAHFPQHDFQTLRLIHQPPRGWDEHWREAARAYHDERHNRVESFHSKGDGKCRT